MASRPLSKSAKRKRNRRGTATWVTFPRCFLLTTGTVLAGFGIAGSISIIRESEHPVPGWLPLVLGLLILVGLWLLLTGLFGSRKDAESMAETADSGHEAGFILMIIAAPLYFVLKFFENLRK